MAETKVLRVEGRDLFTGRPVRVTCYADIIADVTPLDRPVAGGAGHDRDPGGAGNGPDETEAGRLPWLAPGLVDLQINGYQGIDFNDRNLTAEAVAEAARRLLAIGVTGFFPTVITNDDETIASIVRTIADACERDPLVGRTICGIHLEGPFISPEDGPRGAHDPEHVKPPDWERFCRWQRAAGGRIRLVTMSPEWEESAAFIRRCTRAGVTVSIGHTAANTGQIRRAVQAGARLSTHLGNGAHALLPRHPNYIWDQLAEDRLYACIIADGFHLPANVIKVFRKVKRQKLLLVSDAVALCGMPPGQYTTPVGGNVTLDASGRLFLTNRPQLLAGSAKTLPDGIRFMVNGGLADLKTAWSMASVRPAAVMRLDAARGLAPGSPADLVRFHWDNGAFKDVEVIKGGRPVQDGFVPGNRRIMMDPVQDDATRQ